MLSPAQQFESVQHLAAGLSAALTPDDVIGVVAQHSLAPLGACAGFVALTDVHERELEVVRALGADDAGASRRRFSVDAALPSAEAVRTRALVLVASPEERERRYPGWQSGRWSGHGAWAAVPLIADGRALGAMLLCFAEPTGFSESSRQLVETVAALSAQALHRALLHVGERDARARAEDAERRLWFLSEASRLLSSSLDYLTTLQSLARLPLPFLADWCAVDVFEDGELRRVGLAHATPEGERIAESFARKFPVSIQDPLGQARVFRERRPLLATEIDDAQLAAYARSPEELAMLRALGIRSCVLVPIQLPERVLGVLTWVRGPSSKPYDAADLSLAEEMGLRAALAMENARLYMIEQQARSDSERAVEAARELDRRKDEFLAMLGHELRNPLAPISTAVHLLKLRGRTDRELAVIERQVRHLARLVDDLMDVARITRGKVVLDKEVLDARTLVQRALEMASPLFEKKGQHVAVRCPDGPVLIEADPVRFAQVLANLYTNAAKYTQVGGHVTIELSVADGQAVVLVRDDGAGISPTLLPQIFELFVQGPRTLDRAEGGLGIGLTVVRNLITLHGGSVEARSAGSGMGSDFIVRVPLTAGAPRPASATPLAQLELRQKRVLVVDDNEDALDLLSTLLEHFGYAVTRALDAAEALQAVEREDFEVALLDIGLPVMDGYELAARLSQRRRVPRMIAVTGYGQNIDRSRSLASGIAVHLTKPIDVEQLVAAIEGGGAIKAS